MTPDKNNLLQVVRAGIDTYQEPVVYMREDCHVCRSEGFEAQARIEVTVGDRSIIATLNVVSDGWLLSNQAGLSEAAWERLKPAQGAVAVMSHPEPVGSMKHIRTRIYGGRLSRSDYLDIMRDCVAGRLSGLEISAFLTACASRALDLDETIALTGAMIDVGERLNWNSPLVLDKHCIGGLPGNRTSPIIVAIVAACGFVIPKSSSRAITSPAGTADTMATLTPVDLSLDDMRRVVEREGGCLVWGGSIALSPADDILIRVERPLDFDSDAQLVASVLSKKIAAGASHVLLDLPVGPNAKLRTAESAEALGARMQAVAAAFGLNAIVHIADGTQPVGNGIGPALEARDVLAVLAGSSEAPGDLRQRAIDLAGHLLDMAGIRQDGRTVASQTLDSGRALRKFEAICEAQGGRRAPPQALYHEPIVAAEGGVLASINTRKLARLAKLAGAPRAPAAGVDMHVRTGQRIARGEPLITVHAQSPGELHYALEYFARQPDLLVVKAE